MTAKPCAMFASCIDYCVSGSISDIEQEKKLLSEPFAKESTLDT